MYGTSLYTAREKMGARLAEEHPVEADIVVPVPDSGIPAALGYSKASGIPLSRRDDEVALYPPDLYRPGSAAP